VLGSVNWIRWLSLAVTVARRFAVACQAHLCNRDTVLCPIVFLRVTGTIKISYLAAAFVNKDVCVQEILDYLCELSRFLDVWLVCVACVNRPNVMPRRILNAYFVRHVVLLREEEENKCSRKNKKR